MTWKQNSCAAIVIFLAMYLALFLVTVASGQDFIVRSPQADVIEPRLERIKDELSEKYFGNVAPDFARPITVDIQFGPAGGATRYSLKHGSVDRGHISISAENLQQLFEDTGPHEVMHLLLAEWYGDGIPRWLGEGWATYVESDSMHRFRRRQLVRSLSSNRGLPFVGQYWGTGLMTVRDIDPYPDDVSTFYSQSFSVVDFLIESLGSDRFRQYAEDALWNPEQHPNPWTQSTRKWLKYENLSELQAAWREWVVDGSPRCADWSSGERYVAQHS